jgi:hypothetical protein
MCSINEGFSPETGGGRGFSKLETAHQPERTMEKTLIATNVIENPGRIAGVYQAAWRVVFGDAEGVVVHTFEWDGRDIENETLMASVTVSGHVEEEIDCGGVPDRWMDCPMKQSTMSAKSSWIVSKS